VGKNKNKKVDEPIERDDKMVFSGKVIDVLPGTLFSVECEPGGNVVLCTLGGKLRLNKIRVLLGDRVEIEVSPYDMTRGRVTRRF